MIDSLADKVNANRHLVHRGRFLSTNFLLEVGPKAYLVRIHAGRVESVKAGPFVMPRWAFAFRASTESWNSFWAPHPEPGFHDVMAMIKFGTLRIEGDQHPFMANLLYFKELLASLRRSA